MHAAEAVTARSRLRGAVTRIITPSGWWLVGLLVCAVASALLHTESVRASLAATRQIHWLPVWTEAFEYLWLVAALAGLLVVAWLTGRFMVCSRFGLVGLLVGVAVNSANLISDTKFYALDPRLPDHTLVSMSKSHRGAYYVAMNDALQLRPTLAGRTIWLDPRVPEDPFFVFAGARTRMLPASAAGLRCRFGSNVQQRTGFTVSIVFTTLDEGDLVVYPTLRDHEIALVPKRQRLRRCHVEVAK